MVSKMVALSLDHEVVGLTFDFGTSCIKKTDIKQYNFRSDALISVSDPDPDPLHLAGSGSTSIFAPDPDPDPDPLRFIFPDPDPLKALIWIRVAPKQTKTILSK